MENKRDNNPLPPFMEKGSSGLIVALMQQALRTFGAGFEDNRFAAIVPDGEFGDVTERCVRAFQSICKISVDGGVGPQTRAALKANAGFDMDLVAKRGRLVSMNRFVQPDGSVEDWYPQSKIG